ncbi:hypothetical protein ACOMHN_052361 [Nucella lapillus]
MSVVGLPTMLETMINSALQDMTLSPFKMEGREKQTVVSAQIFKRQTYPPLPKRFASSYRDVIPPQNPVGRGKRQKES